MAETLPSHTLFREIVIPKAEKLRFMPMRTAIVGVGGISAPYVDYLQQDSGVTVVACADRDPAFTRKRASELQIERTSTLSEILADPTIEMVINLTNPVSHGPVTKASLEAGKHVFTEKPLATSFEDGKALVELAKTHDLYLGCAPDTFLGLPNKSLLMHNH